MKRLIAAAQATFLATTALVQPALAQDVTEFRIGILGGENAQDRLNNHECLKTYTEEALGVPVKLFAPADYDGVIQGLLGGTLDMAWLGASGYAKIYLDDPEAVTPVLVKVNVDGSIGYHSIGFARKDSGITSLEDMKGKKFGFGDPNSTSGYLIPSIEIPQQTGATMENGDYFGEVVFTGGHEQTIVAVNNGAVDAGLVDMNDLVEIWRSKEIPEGPVVLRTALPEEVKVKMTDLVEGMYEMDKDCTYNISAGESLGFKPITHEAYDSIVAARKSKSN